MAAPLKPIYLLADSQLLFWRDPDGSLLLENVRRHLDGELRQAAYIGAANRDAPEFYGIFEAAMDSIGHRDRRMIRSRYSDTDDAYLRGADVILLAGGDVALGWEVMVSRGMSQVLARRYRAGAVLIGVSAGAVHLGLAGWKDAAAAPDGEDLFDALGLVPAIIDVHDEGRGWGRLGARVGASSEPRRGLGIPSGGGAIYRPGQVIEPVRRPVTEVAADPGGGIRMSEITPPER